jgi:hypothetical protein
MPSRSATFIPPTHASSTPGNSEQAETNAAAKDGAKVLDHPPGQQRKKQKGKKAAHAK